MMSRQPVAQGRVILMFQPAEEDGSGAKAVVADPAYQEIQADWAFAIHIEPGRPFGYVSTCEELINCASLGLKIRLAGKTAHAADPEDGVSPAQAIAKLIPSLDALGQGGPLDDDFRLVTITHVKIGEPSFGVAPGEGEVFATLRTTRDEGMESLETKARKQAITLAEEFGLSVDFEVCDNFAASINDPDAYAVATMAMKAIGIAYGDAGVPMRASEDFGVFGWDAKAAMLCLGPGEDYAALHNPPFSIFDHLEDDNDYSNINFSDHEKLHIYVSRNETAGPSAIVGKEPDLEKLLPEVDVIELHEPAQIAEHDAEALPTELHVSGKLKLASSYGDDYSLQYLWIPAFQKVLILKVRGITVFDSHLSDGTSMPLRSSQHALIMLPELTHIDDITFEVWSPRGILSVSEIYVSETNVFETNLKRVEFFKKDLRTSLFVM